MCVKLYVFILLYSNKHLILKSLGKPCLKCKPTTNIILQHA